MSDPHPSQIQSGEADDAAPIIRKFYREFRRQHLELRQLMTGIDDERQRGWYASVLLNRLMFIYFLQGQGFIKDFNGETNPDYLQSRPAESRLRGLDQYYSGFLRPLFFKGFATPLSHQFGRVDQLLFIPATLNSLTCDYLLRQKVTTNCNIFYVYQLPFPRPDRRAQAFGLIVERAARLTCIAREFDSLAHEVGMSSRKDGVTERVERERLRAELDGLIAHLYGLTEEEFRHILKTFPMVQQEIKHAALEAYRRTAGN